MNGVTRVQTGEKDNVHYCGDDTRGTYTYQSHESILRVLLGSRARECHEYACFRRGQGATYLISTHDPAPPAHAGIMSSPQVRIAAMPPKKTATPVAMAMLPCTFSGCRISSWRKRVTKLASSSAMCGGMPRAP
jgi:hypothetical protein